MEYLSKIHKKKLRLKEKHYSQQEKLDGLLSEYIIESQIEEYAEDVKKAILNPKEAYNSQWLPGPLSYPWALMIVGVAELINYNFNII